MKKNYSVPIILLVFCYIGCKNSNDEKTFTVRFNTDGGSVIAPIIGIINGSTVTLPDEPTKLDYTFVGWYNDNNIFMDEFTSSTTVKQDITVFAKWKYNYSGTWIHKNLLNILLVINEDSSYIITTCENIPVFNGVKGSLSIKNGYMTINNNKSLEGKYFTSVILEFSNFTENDLVTVGKALLGGLPMDWFLSGERMQNYYCIRAFETGFTAEDWNSLSRPQKSLVKAYMSPTHYNTRIFRDADFSFWPNRPPRNHTNGVSNAISYYTDKGGADWQGWQMQ